MNAFGQKSALEIGKNARQIRRSLRALELRRALENPVHLREVIRVVGSQIDPSVWEKDFRRQIRKFVVDEPVFAMLSLRLESSP